MHPADGSQPIHSATNVISGWLPSLTFAFGVTPFPYANLRTLRLTFS